MNKVDAQVIAPEKSKLLLEYIGYFIDSEDLRGKVLIVSDKDSVTGELMCYIDIILNNGFKKRIDTGINAQLSDVLSEQILIDIVETYARDKEVSISYYFTVNSTIDPMHGINIINKNRSCIALDFLCRGPEFDYVVKSYSKKLSAEKNRIQGIRGI